MKNIDEVKVMRDAIAAYGKDMQQAVAIEEMAELTKELCKYKRGKADIRHSAIAEEIADVEIMLEQLKIMFDNAEQVEKARTFKIGRLAHRLVGGVG